MMAPQPRVGVFTMTAEEKRRMPAAIFDTVVADADRSHGCYRLLTERKTGLEAMKSSARRLVPEMSGVALHRAG